MLLLGFAQGLLLHLLILCKITLALSIKVGGQVLSLLTTERTFQVIDTLTSHSQTVLQLVLFLLQSLELQLTDTTGVEIIEVKVVNVEAWKPLAQLLELLLNLFALHTCLFSLEPALLALALFFNETLALGFLLLLNTEALACSFLLLLLSESTGGGLLLAFDNGAAVERLLVFLLCADLGPLQGGSASLSLVLVKVRVNVLAGQEESLSKTSELRTHNLGGSALQPLDSSYIAFG